MARSDEIEVFNECEEIEYNKGKKELRKRRSVAGSSPELIGIADFVVKSLDEKFFGSAESNSEFFSLDQVNVPDILRLLLRGVNSSPTPQCTGYPTPIKVLISTHPLNLIWGWRQLHSGRKQKPK